LSPGSESYDCSKIRKAFIESLSILGLPALDTLIVELEDMRVFLGRKCSTLGQIAEALRYMYGGDSRNDDAEGISQTRRNMLDRRNPRRYQETLGQASFNQVNPGMHDMQESIHLNKLKSRVKLSTEP
jgi:hypothetical protein